MNNGKSQNEFPFDQTFLDGRIEINHETHNMYEFSATPGNSKISGTDFPFDFSFTFESPMNYDAMLGSEFGTGKGLTAFVYDPDQNGETLITISNIGYGNVDGVKRFGVGAATPEPTSGLLLLLGVAGLVLKRKIKRH